jgi:Xaa-Pro aminopeptidase
MITLISRRESPNPDFTWSAGFDLDHAILLDRGGKKGLHVSKMNFNYASRKWKGALFALDMESLGKTINKKDVGISFANESASFYSFLKKHARKVIDIGSDIAAKRSIKRENEVALVKKAARKSLEMIRGIHYSKDKTELQIAKELKMAALGQGLELSYEPIVATGANSSFPHSVPTKKRLGPHVLVDFGVKVEGYCGDITEVIFLEKGGKAELAYGKLNQAFREIIDKIPDAKTGKDVDALAKNVFSRLGLPEMPHSIGHGIGLEVHELPRLKAKSGDRIRGATMAIEPAVYVKNRFGVRFERDILVSKRGNVEIF